MSNITPDEHASRIRNTGKDLDYEAEALESLARSWDHSDPACQALALADAEVFATLHLARVTRRAPVFTRE